MNVKNIVAVILCLFVAASLIYLAAGSQKTQDKPLVDETKLVSSEPPSPAMPASEANNPDVVVYYLHNSVRCIKCKKFETYTQQVLSEFFAEPLRQGTIQWRMLNVDNPQNEHFINDYKLITKSVVLARFKEGKQSEWKNLEKIWQVVDDEAAYKNYIKDEILNFIQER